MQYLTAGSQYTQTASNVLSRALLGAVLAEANGHSPALGAMSAASGELAMQYLLGALYHSDDMSKLKPDEKKTLDALSQATGALAGWLTGGNGADAATGANIAKNALANLATPPKKQQPGDDKDTASKDQ